jgi:hypothetical protein
MALPKNKLNPCSARDAAGEAMSKTYTCDDCGGTFEKGWTEEEARAEQQQNFGDMPDSAMAQVCDDCYRKIMGLPPDAAAEPPDHG